MVDCELCRGCKTYIVNMQICGDAHTREMIVNRYHCKYIKPIEVKKG